ncbi:MAG: type III polyketide synthase [Bacteroidetes bacterium]|nr:type III polyketide synthase [Bacteroidota bacterium]MDA0875590.1 type III polyketide synthase [Bacteroidota bacterium]
MSISLLAIGTAVPPDSYTQDEAARVMLGALEPGSRAAKLVHRIYAHSGIEKRHSVIHDLRNPGGGVFIDAEGRFRSPSTGTRNDRYQEEARPLFAEAGRNALDAAPGVRARDLTHVITVSCTGFYAPGPDFHLIRDLGLSTSVRRVHVGFMGCYAAFPALAMARAFCEADPSAMVLVVCLELCSLHLEPSDEVDDILAFSVFADGAAACIVSAAVPAGASGLRLMAMDTAVAPDSETDMAWTIGDRGFKMVLSTYVPRILEASMAGVVDPVLARSGWSREDVDHWAVHPGGRAILDKVRDGLDLGEQKLGAPRAILRDYGNMSSATILFVLQKVLADAAPGERVMAMAFGPGLTVESALLERF